MTICYWHICNKKLSGKQTKFCSIKCKSKYHVTKNRKTMKIKAVQYKGGKCEKCGYNKSIRALCFHHNKKKDFGISMGGVCKGWAKLKIELDKCQLLCANCHAELHEQINKNMEL